MKIYSINSIPLFIGTGNLSGKTAPQIRFFDVYYIDPLVVGFHVTGGSDE